MIPPTSIDGTDITGATIDGTDVQEITVDGDTVFTAGPTVLEDFESFSTTSDLSNKYTVVANDGTLITNALFGSQSLDGGGSSGTEVFSLPGSGNPTFSQGQKMEFYVRAGLKAAQFYYGVQDQNNHFIYQMQPSQNEIDLRKSVNGSKSDIEAEVGGNFNISDGDEFRLTLEWSSSNVHTTEVFTHPGNSLIVSGSNTDSTFTDGGYGFRCKNTVVDQFQIIS